jgi:integrase
MRVPLRERGAAAPLPPNSRASRRVLSLTALKTGARIGELTALTWADIELGNALIHIRRTYTDRKIGLPKNHEKRSIDITDDLVQTRGRVVGAARQARRRDACLPRRERRPPRRLHDPARRALPANGERRGGARRPDQLEADVPLVPAHLRERVLESGRSITYLALAASRAVVRAGDDRVYRHFERAERKRQAMEGVFGI